MNYFSEIKNSVAKNRPYHIAFYGNSTTSMEFVFPNWVEILRYVLKDYAEMKIGDYQKTHWNIITTNFGMNGASSADLLKRFNLITGKNKPELLIFSGSENDYYYGIDKKITGKNAEQIISQALKNNIRVIFMTTAPSLQPEINKRIEDYIRIYQEVARNFSKHESFLFIDIFKDFPKKDIQQSYSLISEMGNEIVGYKPSQIDPIHFNRYGNAVIAKIILKKTFGINFDAAKFLKDVSDNSKKYPEY
jgi:lysophospholipase L1-like esterase